MFYGRPLLLPQPKTVGHQNPRNFRDPPPLKYAHMERHSGQILHVTKLSEGNFSLQNPTRLPTIGRSARGQQFRDLTASAHRLTWTNADA